MQLLRKNIELIFFEILFFAFVIKVYKIHFHFIDDPQTLIYRIFQTFAHDSLIFLLIIVIFYLSNLKIFNNWSYLFRILCLFILIIYVVDIIVLIMFYNHLVLDDFVKFFLYAPKFLNQIFDLNMILLILLIALFIMVFEFIKEKKEYIQKNHLTALLFMVVFFVSNLFADDGRYIHSWLYKNVLEFNIQLFSQSKPYSQNFIKTIKNNEKFECIDKAPLQPNIIILMVESLSSYQSQLFSGIRNWTPNIDNIAKKNLFYTNFYSNGFVTEDAEIAILTGKIPIYAPKNFSNGGGVSFNGFYNLEDTLPKILQSQNYNTEFITSSDLEFSNTGDWANSTDFDYVEGSDHQFYEDKPRFHFKAAADEFLYQRVHDRISKQQSSYFMFIKTVSSHAPYYHPITKERDEEKVVRYIDEQIGIFYKHLEKQGFFDNGVLFIVGDHHPVIPIKKEQIILYGEEKAPIFVPMIIASKLFGTKQIDQMFSQIDIYNTIKNLVSNKSCTSQYMGDMINIVENKPEFVFYRRGDSRDLVNIFSSDTIYTVKLNGDDTKIVNNQNKIEIVNKINYERIMREKNIN